MMKPDDLETMNTKGTKPPSKSIGIYVPPFKMERLMNELKTKDKKSPEYQKVAWEALKKSINGIVNKVNVSNIQNIIVELFSENLLKGKGLLSKSVI